jgi:hypothetical protein
MIFVVIIRAVSLLMELNPFADVANYNHGAPMELGRPDFYEMDKIHHASQFITPDTRGIADRNRIEVSA